MDFSIHLGSTTNSLEWKKYYHKRKVWRGVHRDAKCLPTRTTSYCPVGMEEMRGERKLKDGVMMVAQDFKVFAIRV